MTWGENKGTEELVLIPHFCYSGLIPVVDSKEPIGGCRDAREQRKRDASGGEMCHAMALNGMQDD